MKIKGKKTNNAFNLKLESLETFEILKVLILETFLIR